MGNWLKSRESGRGFGWMRGSKEREAEKEQQFNFRMVEDIAILRLCVLLLVPPTQTSSLLPFPYLIRIFNTSFDSSLWGNWLRFSSCLCMCTASVLAGLGVCLARNKVLKAGFGLLVTGVGCALINVEFGLRGPVLILCSKGLDDLCFESLQSCKLRPPLPGSEAKAWEAFLYTLALCLQLTLLPVLIQLTYRKATTTSLPRVDHKVCDTESTVVVLNVSTGEALPTDTPTTQPSKASIQPSLALSQVKKLDVEGNLGKREVVQPRKQSNPPIFSPINPLFSHNPNKKSKPGANIPNRRVLRRP